MNIIDKIFYDPISKGLRLLGKNGQGFAVGTQPDSMIRVGTGNGHGSSSTKIRRFTNVLASVGTDITYTTSADTSSLGSVFTINRAGVYAITYSDGYSGSTGAWIGVSLSATSELTTNVTSVANANVLAIVTTPITANNCGTCAVTVKLAVGDTIRAHTNGTVDMTDYAKFTITQVAKL